MYYEGRRSGRIAATRKCWEHQNCQMQCRYRTNPNSGPISVLPKKVPSDSRTRLLRTAGALQKLTAMRKPKAPARAGNSDAAYKLIAQVLKGMLQAHRGKL